MKKIDSGKLSDYRMALTWLLIPLIALAFLVFGWTTAWTFRPNSVEAKLARVVKVHDLSPLDMGEPQNPELVALGQQLFFDPILSGNLDVSCATCHHPDFAGADGRPLSAGTGGSGLGPERELGEGRGHIPRNAPELFNRGSKEWVTMFWDGRIAADIYADVEGQFVNPADEALPVGLASALAVQAMFPPTSADEMRGMPNDRDVLGKLNQVALGAESSENAAQMTWQLLTERLKGLTGYRALFTDAFPETPLSTIGFEHAATAIAAFEIDAFSFDDSRWNRYLMGDTDLLSDAEKRGALLFYGEANCVACHSGSLMTDQEYHNIAVPQFGPGKNNQTGFDFGRYLETNDQLDLFAFRTPPLANIALTGPYMHNGAYADLEDAVRHHLNPEAALITYDETQLPTDLQDTVADDENTHLFILDTLDPIMAEPTTLSEGKIIDLLAFLNALTAPGAMELDHLIPESVPSGLPVGN